MATYSTRNYIQYVAAALLGHEPDAQLHPTDSDQWCLRADNPARLADHMERFGYEVTLYDKWVGVSGSPTSSAAVRDLEVRRAQARVKKIQEADDTAVLQMTNRF